MDRLLITHYCMIASFCKIFPSIISTGSDRSSRSVSSWSCFLLLDSYNDDVQPKRRLEDVIHLAELCIEVLQQNEEHHAEVIISLCTPCCILSPIFCLLILLSAVVASFYALFTAIVVKPFHQGKPLRCMFFSFFSFYKER